MATKRKRKPKFNHSRLSANRSDIVSQLIKDALPEGVAKGFNDIFTEITTKLKEHFPNKGEEILRLQSYEILMELVNKGVVERDGNRLYRVAAKGGVA